ncbi:MAG: XRE family transcriptional regulator [Massilia sp.]
MSTLLALARALGLDLMLVPASLRSDLEQFVQSGGRFLGQPAGIGTPQSLVDTLLQNDPPTTRRRSPKRIP